MAISETTSVKSIQPAPRHRLLKTEEVFRHPFITVLEDTVVLPSGSVSKWLRWEGGGVSCVICLTAKGKVLVSYQYNNASQRVVEEFPGGGIHKDESPLHAATRELEEEVGLRAGKIKKIEQFLLNNRKTDDLCHVFLATELEECATRPDDGELIETEWVDVAEFDRRIAEGEVENATTLAAWAFFRARVGSA